MDKQNEHILYLLGSEAVCPECKGMLRFNLSGYCCNDCRRSFVISSYIDYDRSIKVMELSGTANGVENV